MRSPVAGLFYYHWVGSRWSVAVIASLCIAATCLIRIGAWLLARTPEQFGFATALDLIFAGYVTVGGASLMGAFYPEGQLAAIRPGEHLLNMPVRTRLITGSLFVYTAIVVAFLSGGEIILHFSCFGNDAAIGPLGHWQRAAWMYPILCVMAAALLQAGWLMAGLRNELVQGLGLVGLATIGGGGILLSLSEDYWPWGLALSGVGLPIAYGVSHAGIAGFRCQRMESIVPWIVETFSIRSFRTQPFGSVESALTWYSWRRRCRLVLAGTACCMPFGLLLVVGSEVAYLHRMMTEAVLPNFLLGWSVAVAVCWSLYTVARDYVESQRSSPFLFVYPVRTVRLAHGVLLPMAGTFAFVLLCTFPVVVTLLHVASPAHVRWETTLAGVSTIAVGCGAGTWVCMWYAIPFFYVALVFGACIALGHFVFGLNDPDPIPWILAATMVVYSVASLLIAHRYRRLERKSLAFMAGAWGLSVFAAVLFAFQIHLVSQSVAAATSPHMPLVALLDQPAALLTVLFAATLLAPLPFVDLPAVIDFYRHRE